MSAFRSDIKCPPTHNARVLLERVALMENTNVVCLIDDLNDLHHTQYRVSDYLRNRQLPLALKSALRAKYQELALEQFQIIGVIDRKAQKIPLVFGILLAFLVAIVLV